jgi:hypothetical protein
MASDEESIDERLNDRELTEEEQDAQLKIVKENLVELKVIAREMEYMQKEIKLSKYNTEANVLLSKNVGVRNKSLIASKKTVKVPYVLLPSLDSYAGALLEYKVEIIQIVEHLDHSIKGIMSTYGKQYRWNKPKEQTNALLYKGEELYEFIFQEFQKILQIIRIGLQFSEVVCINTDNKTTFNKWFTIYKEYSTLLQSVSETYNTYRKFEGLFHLKLYAKYIERHEVLLFEYITEIKKADAVYDLLKKREAQNLSNRRKRGGRRTRKKRV